jgi:hypothetical protein
MDLPFEALALGLVGDVPDHIPALHDFLLSPLENAIQEGLEGMCIKRLGGHIDGPPSRDQVAAA